VAARHGVVTLTGTMRPGPGDEPDLLLLVLRLIWDIDGVIDVVNRLGQVPAHNLGTRGLLASLGARPG
jgi:hypothetical protein